MLNAQIITKAANTRQDSEPQGQAAWAHGKSVLVAEF